MALKNIGVTLVALVVTILFSVSALAEFPSSSDSSKHTWTKMGSNPYSGSVEQACNLVGLNVVECDEYQRMRAENSCEYVDVPNGVVLDKLVFTKDGKDVVQDDVKVALKSAPTRRSRVCSIGNKAVVSFDGCNNLAVVDAWRSSPVVEVSKGLPQARPYRPTTLRGGCPLGDSDRFIAISVLEEAAAEHECSRRFIKSLDGRIARPEGVTGEYDGNGLDEDRLSRTCGGVLNDTYRAGELNHGIEVVVAQGDQEYLIFQGSVRGKTLMPGSDADKDVLMDGFIRVPESFTTGTVEVRYDDYGKLLSPTAFHNRERVENLTRGCRINRQTAIELNGGGFALK